MKIRNMIAGLVVVAGMIPAVGNAAEFDAKEAFRCAGYIHSIAREMNSIDTGFTAGLLMRMGTELSKDLPKEVANLAGYDLMHAGIDQAKGDSQEERGTNMIACTRMVQAYFKK